MTLFCAWTKDLKSFEPITLKFSTFIVNINIYGVIKRFLKFLILS